LKLDPRDTSTSVQELKAILIRRWEESSSEEAVPPVPSVQDVVFSPTASTKGVKRPIESLATEGLTHMGNKKKKEDLGPATRIELTNWWKVSNCVTGSATCSGITDSGFVVSSPFPNRALYPTSEIPGEGNVTYLLGNHSADGDQIEDNFGPWPAKMSGLNAVHLQFRSLLSESITEFSTRLGMNVNGSRLDHLSSGMILYNTLKLVNATEVRKALKKSVEVSHSITPMSSPFSFVLLTSLLVSLCLSFVCRAPQGLTQLLSLQRLSIDS
jgi:hypothetical protein